MRTNADSGKILYADEIGEGLKIYEEFVVERDTRPTVEVFPFHVFDEDYGTHVVRKYLINWTLQRQRVVMASVGYDNWCHTPNLIADAERLGMERPEYEDAIFFAEQHYRALRKDSLRFPHKEWKDLEQVEQWKEIVVLSMKDDLYRVGMCSTFGHWGPGARFVMVKERIFLDD